MQISAEQILAEIRARDVGYYNKEIIKNNKEITKYKDELSSSFGLVADAPQVNKEVPMSEPPLEACQWEEENESGQETLPRTQDLIQRHHVHRAIVQLHHNENSKVKHKLKVRLNADFGDGIENIDFICALTKDLGNFKKFSPPESRDVIHAWVDELRSQCRDAGIKPYMGKFHCNQGWNSQKQQTNQKEPWCAAVLWYDPTDRNYYGAVRIYDWHWGGVLGKDTIGANQKTVKAQTLWINPQHAPKHSRPQTWAQKRWGTR
jgi:hypothetical protein